MCNTEYYRRDCSAYCTVLVHIHFSVCWCSYARPAHTNTNQTIFVVVVLLVGKIRASTAAQMPASMFTWPEFRFLCPVLDGKSNGNVADDDDNDGNGRRALGNSDADDPGVVFGGGGGGGRNGRVPGQI